MADVKINLEAVSGQFITSLAKAQQAANALTAQLATLQAANTKLITSTTQAANAQKQFASSGSGSNASVFKLATAIGLATTAFNALFDAAKRAGSAVKGAFEAGVTNLDDFKKATISSAAAITNIADMSNNAGKTYEQVFKRNLEATKQIFIELEKLSAKYFATSIDLQLAYNTFAQRGILIRRSELPLLAQLTDQILLLTQGQQSTIQIQEEIRSLVNGTLRTTAQLSQLIKGYGLDVKEIAAQIKATGSLVPLEGILRGAQAATNEIQKTFIATYNGLEVAVKQIGRLGLEQFYAQLIRSTQQFTELLNTNKVKIIGLLAAIGRAAGDILDRISAAASQLFKFNDQSDKSFDGFTKFLAGTVTAVDLIIRSVQTLINLFALLPEVFEDAGRALNLAFSPNEKIKAYKNAIFGSEDALKNLQKQQTLLEEGGASPRVLLDHAKAIDNTKSELQELRNTLAFIEDPLDTLYNKAIAVAKGLNWSKEARAAGKVISDLGDKMKAAVAPLANANPRAVFNRELNQIQGAKVVGEASGQFQLNQQVETTEPTRRGFNPTPEQLSEIERLTNSVTSAQDRYNRSARTAAQTEIAGKIEVELDAIKRATSLASQGFKLMEGTIVGLRSNAVASFNFIRANIQSFITGVRADFTPLIEDVAQNTSGITNAVYDGLKQQYNAAVQGLEDFKQKTEEASVLLRESEVAPHTNAADKIRQEAEADYKIAVEGEQKLLDTAREVLQVAIASRDAQKIADAEKLLAAEEAEKFNVFRIAQDKRLVEESKADLQIEIARNNGLRIAAQAQNAISAEATRLEKEKLRILQDQELVYGRILKQNAEALTNAQRARVSAQRQGPTTDLQSGANAISDQRATFAVEMGQAVGELNALRDAFFEAGYTSKEAAAGLREKVNTQLAYIETLKQEQEATVRLLEWNNALRTSYDALAGAVSTAVNGLVDALTGAFEGKKTNFARLGKGLVDNLVKDSLKDVIQSGTKALQDGLKAGFEAMDIGPDMAKTLGPAFLAGFGLIASFVLGQLLGDQGGSATAGNPTVGIQSSEQVRGLIGGETQIPIGQIAESLQDALVPTNLLLSRIANSVERMSVGGLSGSSIESIIERSVNDALQIQPA